jgi:hypothetical protein
LFNALGVGLVTGEGLDTVFLEEDAVVDIGAVNLGIGKIFAPSTETGPRLTQRTHIAGYIRVIRAEAEFKDIERFEANTLEESIVQRGIVVGALFATIPFITAKGVHDSTKRCNRLRVVFRMNIHVFDF